MLIQEFILFFFKHLFFHDYPSIFLSSFLLKQWMGLQMGLCACIYMDECGCLREWCIQIHTCTSKLENCGLSKVFLYISFIFHNFQVSEN